MTGSDTAAALADRLAKLSPAKRAMFEQALLARRQHATDGTGIPRRTGEGPAPLTFAQRGMWFLDQWQPGSALYGVREALRVVGALDGDALRRAFAAVVERHEILRTTFGDVDGQPVQLIGPVPSEPLPLVDLTGLAPTERADAVERLRADDARRPFSLAEGPLLRAVLIRVADTEHVLLLSLHHIVADGWSYGLLVRELSTHYAAFSQGRAADAPELPIRFADYACWQQEQRDSPELLARLAWWKAELAGAPALLNLPTDRPRPPVLSHRGGTADLAVPATVAAALRDLAGHEGATLFMTLLAAFQVLLHRWTGDPEVVVGSPVAGRTERGLENLIGCFVNTLAMRTDLSGAPGFRALLGHVRELTIAAYAHQDIPFERLVEELRLDRGANHSPVFQAMFAFQNTPPAGWHLPGAAVRPLGVVHPAEALDLSLTMTEDEAGLHGTLSYSADLFDADTIARLLREFGSLLAAIAEDEDHPVAAPSGSLRPAHRPAGPTPAPASGPEPEPAAEAPAAVLEPLRAIWAEVLADDTVTSGTSFFTAGGHSLLAVQVASRVRRAFEVDLPLSTLFEAPTLAGYAQRVDAARRARPGAGLPPIPPTDLSGPVPLSHAQRRLWFVDQLDHGGSHHNVGSVLRLDGPLHATALSGAVRELCLRHASLRTTIEQVHGVVTQRIGDRPPAPVPLVDLSGLAPDTAQEEARRLAEAEARRPFDLRHGPLLRVALVRLGADHHLLLVTVHHIITDAWSSDLMFEELWQLYSAELDGTPAELPPLPIQYADYAVWEQRTLDEAALREAAEYWRGQLAGAPETLDLPPDLPLPATPVFRSRTLPYQLSEEQTEALTAFCLREGVTPFMVALAAYLVLLHRHTGRSDLVVGTGTANRGSVETERVIGFFTNQLVLRTQVRGDRSVRELLAAVRGTTLDAHSHGHFPFDRLVELIRPTRRINRAPLFQVEIEYHRRTDRPTGPPGVTVAPQAPDGATTTLDLSLHVVQTETVLRGGLVYNADAFAPATAERLLGELLELLPPMIAEPGASIDEVARQAEQNWRQAAARARAAAARARFDSVRTGTPRSPQNHGRT
ncbi:condensation domain-containing protein [Kitasatospora sp. NBC_00374]|uniref:condensation domain-containing protein n=1 Tax=Kitasatospora sp. NBC_00374 TaxID=2975964 RepID=UPI0030E4FE66